MLKYIFLDILSTISVNLSARQRLAHCRKDSQETALSKAGEVLLRMSLLRFGNISSEMGALGKAKGF